MGGMRLRLEQIARVPDDLWNQSGPGAVDLGWDLTLMGLGRHVGTGASVDPNEAAVWPASPEGKEFVRLSSDKWCTASIDAGTAADAAKDAASRTTAFCTVGN
jgi:hypothetical protein